MKLVFGDVEQKFLFSTQRFILAISGASLDPHSIVSKKERKQNDEGN